MTTGYKRIEIPLSQLAMDVENARHKKVSSQPEVVEAITNADPGASKKTLKLISDIVSYGPNPSDSPIVAKIGKNDYKVLEGNRRITALKAIQNPDILPESLRKKVRELTKDFPPITAVECVLFDDIETAYHFIELKHLGENEGAGTVRWNTIQQDRHEMRRSGTSKNLMAIRLLEYVQDSPLVDSETKDAAEHDKYPITTLERILADTDFRHFIGITYDEGQLLFTLDETEAVKAINKIVRDLGEKKIKVGDVFNKELRLTYRQGFGVSGTPDQTKTNPTPTPPQNGSKTQNAKKSSASSKQSGGPSQYRKTLVPRGTTLPIQHADFTKHRQLFEEMKQLQMDREKGSGVKYFPIAASMMIRAFLELSTNAYLIKKKIPCPHTPTGKWENNQPLVTRVKHVLGLLDGGSQIKAGWKKPIDKMLSHKTSSGNPNTIHDFMHSQTAIPSPADLKVVWDQYYPYFSHLWSELK